MDCRNIMGIATDTEAEELLLWIQEQSDLRDRLIETDKAMIQKYQDLMVKHEDGYKMITDQAMMVLGEYCKNNPTKTTKTTTKLMLPSGTLQWKRKDAKIVRDDAKLILFAKKYMPELVKTTETPQWDEIKKKIIIAEEKTILTDENGEVLMDENGLPLFTSKDIYVYETSDGEPVAVDGVELVPQDDVFEVRG